MKDRPSSQWIHSSLTCLDVTDRASEYLDDRLPNLTKVLVGLHLTSCVYCRTYVKQIDLVSSMLRSLPSLYPGPVELSLLMSKFAAHHGQLVSGP
ncbi:MAG: zf-HC2 domain-containing protein [Nitrospirales bacterium]